jgi:ABC-type multidrug transport system permease subunit
LGRRSRKRSAGGGTAAAPARPAARPPRRSAAEKDTAVRSELRPYRPGERPLTIKISIALCVFGILVLAIGSATGVLDVHRDQRFGLLASLVILAVAAAGLWRMKYWAALGLQAILLLNILAGFLFLLRASSVKGFLIAFLMIVPAGFLGYKLIRTMARMQMPERPGARRV